MLHQEANGLIRIGTLQIFGLVDRHFSGRQR